MIGLKQFTALCVQALFPLGLGFAVKTGPAQSCSGVGGKARTLFNAVAPMALGGIHGLISLVVVAEDVPMLIPMGLLRGLKARIVTGQARVQWGVHPDAFSDIHYLPSGHCAVDVTDGLKNFKVPPGSADAALRAWHPGFLQQQAAEAAGIEA